MPSLWDLLCGGRRKYTTKEAKAKAKAKAGRSPPPQLQPHQQPQPRHIVGRWGEDPAYHHHHPHPADASYYIPPQALHQQQQQHYYYLQQQHYHSIEQQHRALEPYSPRQGWQDSADRNKPNARIEAILRDKALEHEAVKQQGNSGNRASAQRQRKDSRPLSQSHVLDMEPARPAAYPHMQHQHHHHHQHQQQQHAAGRTEDETEKRSASGKRRHVQDIFADNTQDNGRGANTRSAKSGQKDRWRESRTDSMYQYSPRTFSDDAISAALFGNRIDDFVHDPGWNRAIDRFAASPTASSQSPRSPLNRPLSADSENFSFRDWRQGGPAERDWGEGREMDRAGQRPLSSPRARGIGAEDSKAASRSQPNVFLAPGVLDTATEQDDERTERVVSGAGRSTDAYVGLDAAYVVRGRGGTAAVDEGEEEEEGGVVSGSRNGDGGDDLAKLFSTAGDVLY